MDAPKTMFRLLFRVLNHIQWIINGILIQTIQEKTTVYKLEFIFLKEKLKRGWVYSEEK